MKVASKSRAAVPARNVPAAKRPPVQDHDLPILALEELPGREADWKSLLEAGGGSGRAVRHRGFQARACEAGVEPALLIGGERRWHGRR